MKNLKLRTLFRNTSSTFLWQILSLVLFVGLSILLARKLGPNGNGQYALVILWPSLLATLFNFGISPALVYFLGSSAVSVRKARRTMMKFWAILSLTGLLLSVIVMLFWGRVIFPNIPAFLLFAGLLVYPIMLLPDFLLSMLQGMQDFRSYNMAQLAAPITTLLFAAILIVVLRWGVYGGLLAYALGQLASALVSWKAVARLVPFEVQETEFNDFGRRLINFGWKAHLGNVLSLLNYRIDNFLLNLFLNPAAIGIYVVAVQIAEGLWLLSSVVSTVLLPRLSQLTSEEEKRRVLTPLVSRWVLAVSLMGALVLMILIKPLVIFLFGKSYISATLALLWILPGIIGLAFSRVLAQDIIARGRPEINLYISIAVVLANVVANLALIPHMGINGSALASTISYLLQSVLLTVIYSRLSGNAWYRPLLFGHDDIELVKAGYSTLRASITKISSSRK